MSGTRALRLIATAALVWLLCACATSQMGAQVNGPRGVHVTVTNASKCGYRVVGDESPAPLVALPKLVRIDVGCASLTSPSDIAKYVRTLRAPDAPKCTGEPLVWGAVPFVIGTDAQGVHWLVHLPASSCGAPQEPALDLTMEIVRTGHLAAAATGIVDGTLTLQGGCAFCTKPRPLSGTVRLLGRHGPIDVKVGKSGKFVVRVQAGRYQVVGGLSLPYQWPLGTCGLHAKPAHGERWGSVNVEKGDHLHIQVQCIAA